MTRECVSCGTWFEVPRKGKYYWSERQTCSDTCAYEIHSWNSVQMHVQAKKNPEEYKRWVGRDYTAMAHLSHKSREEKKKQLSAEERVELARRAERQRSRYWRDPEKFRARSREYMRRKRLEKKNAAE